MSPPKRPFLSSRRAPPLSVPNKRKTKMIWTIGDKVFTWRPNLLTSMNTLKELVNKRPSMIVVNGNKYIVSLDNSNVSYYPLRKRRR